MDIKQSNAKILRELGARLKQQRASRNIDQATLAYESGVSLRTLSRLENGRGVSFEAVIGVMRALGILDRLELMIPSTDISPVQRAKTKVHKPRQRARRKAEPKKPDKPAWQGFAQTVTFEDEGNG
jgi:transcriptional regulator with XRE-family HTH domain